MGMGRTIVGAALHISPNCSDMIAWLSWKKVHGGISMIGIDLIGMIFWIRTMAGAHTREIAEPMNNLRESIDSIL
jgi:hypothetical protein